MEDPTQDGPGGDRISQEVRPFLLLDIGSEDQGKTEHNGKKVFTIAINLPAC